MDFLQAILLGIVQGATEFLPVSSSGHLVLVPWLLGWPAAGLVFDTLVHWGTLVAVVAYFRDDLWALARAWLNSVRERSLNPDTSTGLSADPYRRLAWLIVIGSIPAGLASFLLQDFFESLFGRPGWAAAFLLVTGLLLIASERWHSSVAASGFRISDSPRRNPQSEIRNPKSIPTVAGTLIIGLAQAFAIAPGISRSGATIAAGLLVGLNREESARFSFLLAVPVIFGAGAHQLAVLLTSGTALTQAPMLITGFAAAGITGYLAIRFLLDYLQRHTLYVFAVYCWIFGLSGLIVYWLR